MTCALETMLLNNIKTNRKASYVHRLERLIFLKLLISKLTYRLNTTTKITAFFFLQKLAVLKLAWMKGAQENPSNLEKE